MLIFALFMPSTKTVTTGKSETYIYMYTLFIIYIQAKLIFQTVTTTN